MYLLIKLSILSGPYGLAPPGNFLTPPWGDAPPQLRTTDVKLWVNVQNHRQKIFSRRALRLYRGLGILKFDKDTDL